MKEKPDEAWDTFSFNRVKGFSGFYRFRGFRVVVAASPQKKRKPTPPRCARQPLPREGACVDTLSFLWKEVPRRDGGWMGKAVFLYRSLPLEGKMPRRGG